ncbi:MAG: DNA polymerase III subunit beta [Planctomycetes bacterium]|nr:DNA polymerase III subunit beta [Planctomycetota bacterium]
MSVPDALIERCVATARQFGVRRLILFGSALDAPETARDVDLACEGVEGWDIFRLGAQLEEELGVNVDLVPLSPDDRFSQHVVQRGRVIYERD